MRMATLAETPRYRLGLLRELCGRGFALLRVLQFRSEIYVESQKRRPAQHKRAITPE